MASIRQKFTPRVTGDKMLYTEAIEILQPNTNRMIAPVCVVRKPNGKIDAQLPTGNPDRPFIAINDNLIMESDLMEVLDPVSDDMGCLEVDVIACF